MLHNQRQQSDTAARLLDKRKLCAEHTKAMPHDTTGSIGGAVPQRWEAALAQVSQTVSAEGTEYNRNLRHLDSTQHICISIYVRG